MSKIRSGVQFLSQKVVLDQIRSSANHGIQHYKQGNFKQAETEFVKTLKPLLSKPLMKAAHPENIPAVKTELLGAMSHLGEIYARSHHYHNNYSKAAAIFQYSAKFADKYEIETDSDSELVFPRLDAGGLDFSCQEYFLHRAYSTEREFLCFIEVIRTVQNEYRALNQAYQTREQAKGHQYIGQNDTKEQFVHDMMRELVILHQLKASSVIKHNQSQELQLTKSHLDHTEDTIKKEIDKSSIQSFADKDKRHLANNIYKVISSDKWQKELNSKNQLKSQVLIEKNKKVAQEVKQVHSTLSEFKNEKQHAKTNEELFAVIRKESEYLVGLEGKLEYPKDHDKQLLAKISRVGEITRKQKRNSAENNLPIDSLDHLHNNLQSVANYAVKKNILSKEQLSGHLKADHDITEIHKNISQDCFKHHCDIISEHHKQIISGKTIKHDGHKFDCPIKYLEHWKSNAEHHLLPMQDINSKLDHHLKQQKDMGLDHGPSNSRGHGIDLDM